VLRRKNHDYVKTHVSWLWAATYVFPIDSRYIEAGFLDIIFHYLNGECQNRPFAILEFFELDLLIS
jgi:hypothetical protein